MNPASLEEKVDNNNIINMITSCLEQIKDYPDYQRRYSIIYSFIKKSFPKINEFDTKEISIMISLYLKDYEYDYKDLTKSPNTALSHPLVSERKPGVIPSILKSIRIFEADYIESLSKTYPK